LFWQRGRLHQANEAETSSLALRLARSPCEGSRAPLLDTHARLATHQTGHYKVGTIYPTTTTTLILARHKPPPRRDGANMLILWNGSTTRHSRRTLDEERIETNRGPNHTAILLGSRGSSIPTRKRLGGPKKRVIVAIAMWSRVCSCCWESSTGAASEISDGVGKSSAMILAFAAC